MKYKRVFSFLILFLLMLLLLMLPARAEQVPYFTSNSALLQDAVAEMNRTISDYHERDTSADKHLSLPAIGCIVMYQNRLNDLKASPEFATQEQHETIYLLQSQGLAEASLCYTREQYRGRLGQSSQKIVDDFYNNSIKEIRSSESYNQVYEIAEQSEKELIITIYSEMIRSLTLPTDSSEIAVIAAGAKSQLRQSAESGWAIDPEQIYWDAAKSIAEQRKREEAIFAFSLAYDAIYGEGSYNARSGSDEHIATFLYEIRIDKAYSALNESIRSGLVAILEDLRPVRESQYLKELYTTVYAALDACCAPTHAIASPIDALWDFPLRLARADAMDRLLSYATQPSHTVYVEAQRSLLEQLLSPDGALMCAENAQKISFITEQGRIRLHWLSEADRMQSLLDKHWNSTATPHDDSLFLLYQKGNLTLSQASTLQNAENLLRQLIAEGNQLCNHSEADAYRLRHKACIEHSADKPLPPIESLRHALAEADLLSVGAAEELRTDILRIAEFYREQIVQSIKKSAATTQAPSSRIAEGEYYVGRTQSILLTNGSAYIGAMEDILACAEAAFQIWDLCEEMKGENTREALNIALQDSLQAIRSLASQKETLQEELALLKTQAHIAFSRITADGAMSELITQEDGDAVRTCVTSARQSLNACNDLQSIATALSKVKLDVARIRCSEKLDKEEAAFILALQALDRLTESDLNQLIQESSKKRTALQNTILQAESEQKLRILSEDVTESFTTLLTTAEAKNLTRAIEQALAELHAKAEEHVATLSAFQYLSNEKKADHQKTIRSLLYAAEASILQKKSVSEIDNEADSVQSTMAEQIHVATKEDLMVAKEQKISFLRSISMKATQEISAMDYLSASEKSSFIMQINNEIEEFVFTIRQSESVDCLIDLWAGCEASISNLRNNSLEKNLENSRITIEALIQEKHEKMQTELLNFIHLSNDEKYNYKSELSRIAEQKTALLTTASDIAFAQKQLSDFTVQGESILSSAQALDLSHARDDALSQAQKAAGDALDSLDALQELSEEEHLRFEQQIQAALSLCHSTIASAEEESAMQHALQALQNKLSQCINDAISAHTEQARRRALFELATVFDALSPADYHPDHYAKLEKLRAQFLQQISEASTVSQISELLQSIPSQIAQIPTLFEDARTKATDELTQAYQELYHRYSLYSERNLTRLCELYKNTLAELKEMTAESSIEVLNELCQSRIDLLRQIPISYLSCGDQTLTSQGFSGYPAGHQIQTDGLWGTLSSTSGLPYNAMLTMYAANAPTEAFRHLQSAAKADRVRYSGASPMSGNALSALIRDSSPISLLHLSLTTDGVLFSEDSGGFDVRILLPASWRTQSRLKVVYLREDGSAEFYDATVENGYLCFSSAHLSDFLLIAEKQIRLSPLLWILSIIGITELIPLSFICVKRIQKRRHGVLCSFSPFPLVALAKILPPGGIGAAILLTILDLALGGCLLYFLLQRGKEKKGVATPSLPPPPTQDKPTISPKNTARVNESAPLISPVPLPAVCAEEADTLMSDAEVQAQIFTEAASVTPCRNGKKAMINLDTISAHFQADQTVSLDALLEKGLIPQKTCYLKVLARGTLDKPLTVRAHSFSAAAAKMILLTGGTVIRIE